MEAILEFYNQEWKKRVEQDKEMLIADFDREVYEFLKNLVVIDAKREYQWDGFNEIDHEYFVLTAKSVNFMFKILQNTVSYTGENIFKRKFDDKWQETRLNKKSYTSTEFLANPYNQQKARLVKYLTEHFKSLEIILLIEKKNKNSRLNSIFESIVDQKVVSVDIEKVDPREDEFFIELENGVKLLVKKVE